MKLCLFKVKCIYQRHNFLHARLDKRQQDVPFGPGILFIIITLHVDVVHCVYMHIVTVIKQAMYVLICHLMGKAKKLIIV